MGLPTRSNTTTTSTSVVDHHLSSRYTNQSNHPTSSNHRSSLQNPIIINHSSSSSSSHNHHHHHNNGSHHHHHLNNSTNSINGITNGHHLRHQSHRRGRNDLRESYSKNQARNSHNTHHHHHNKSQDRGGGAGPTTATGQLEAKVVILGMQGVGKTSIVHRYTTGSFSYSLTSTIGASFCTKKLSVDGCKVRLQIWDTAGQERFRSMAPMYYRGANAAILVYDITNEDSFLDIQNWLEELRQNMTSDLVIQIVGSKADLSETKRVIDLQEAYQKILEWTTVPSSSVTPHPGPQTPFRFNLIQDEDESFWNGMAEGDSRTGFGTRWNNVGITEVSAKDDIGIEDLFLILTRRLVLRKVEIDELRVKRSRDSIFIDSGSGPGAQGRNQRRQSGQEDPDGRRQHPWCC